jgi:hypothetical protein
MIFEARALEARNLRKSLQQQELRERGGPVCGPSNPIMHSPRLGPYAPVSGGSHGTQTGARPKSFVLGTSATSSRGRGGGSPVDSRSQSSQTSQESQEDEEGEGFRSGYERRGTVRTRSSGQSSSPADTRPKKSSRR